MMDIRKKTAEGNNGRVVSARLYPGTDLMKGITEICTEHRIKNGYIGSCIGSLKQAKILVPIKIPEKKAGYGYGDPITLSGPLELLSATGLICHDKEGNILLHLHASLVDDKGNSYGGHLLEAGNIVLLTTDFVIQELEGIDMARKYDDETDILMFFPQQVQKEDELDDINI